MQDPNNIVGLRKHYFADMCPKPNYSSLRLSTASQVADLPEAIPNLFQVLTAERDPDERWLTFTFPVDFDISMFKPQLEKEYKYRTREYWLLNLKFKNLYIQIAFSANYNNYNFFL